MDDGKLDAYRAQPLALLTKHDKGAVIAPVLAQVGLSVITTDGFDTDALGTFAGEVERTLPPLECARRKARLACELTDSPVGLGSEGSFGGGPMPGIVNWDEEILVLHDAANDFEIVARASGPISLRQFDAESLSQLQQRLSRFAPDQAWIVRYSDRVYKGLAGFEAVRARLNSLQWLDDDRLHGAVRIEPDLRAMHCPERRAYIRKAAQQLAERLQSPCPICTAPNFWHDAVERGLPCRWCGEPSDVPAATIMRCQGCAYETRVPVPSEFADPGQCLRCNP